jgi:hypothetical protein
VKTKQHRRESFLSDDLAKLKKELVEKDTSGLIEFIETRRTLDDLYGLEKIKAWLRQDVALWKKNDVAALPKGYLLCGPVGTGKTFLVECLAGEAGAPVVKLKNFRDKWVGSSEDNLEKIFRLIHALGRCDGPPWAKPASRLMATRVAAVGAHQSSRPHSLQLTAYCLLPAAYFPMGRGERGGLGISRAGCLSVTSSKSIEGTTKEVRGVPTSPGAPPPKIKNIVLPMLTKGVL